MPFAASPSSGPEHVDATFVHVPALDVAVTPMTADDVISWLQDRTGKRLLLNHNLHSAYLYHTNDEFRRTYALADRIVIDGAPVLALANFSKQAGRLSARHRIGSTDWIAELGRLPGQRSLAIYGANAQSNSNAVEVLQSRLTGWVVHGLDGYQPAARAVEWLRSIEPDLVIVGLGMPRQEIFLQNFWAQLPRADYATVGGAIDYIAGANALAPRWIGRLGLEWMWRLIHEPRRLGFRYLVEPILLTALAARRVLRICKTGIHEARRGRN